MSICIDIKQVTFSYNGNHPAIQNVNLSIPEGSFMGICGSNGCGKTTLTFLFNGLIPHMVQGKLTGDVMVNGISTREKNVPFFASIVGMLFQNPDYSLFNLTVEEEIRFGLTNLGIKNQEKRIRKALADVGMEKCLKTDPHTLSLGQKQKVNLASVLSIDPNIIVLDEPSAMLDYASSVDLYKRLSHLHKSGKTIIVVEHDTDFLHTFASDVILMDHGRIENFGRAKEILAQKKKLTSLGIKIPARTQL